MEIFLRKPQSHLRRLGRTLLPNLPILSGQESLVDVVQALHTYDSDQWQAEEMVYSIKGGSMYKKYSVECMEPMANQCQGEKTKGECQETCGFVEDLARAQNDPRMKKVGWIFFYPFVLS